MVDDAELERDVAEIEGNDFLPEIDAEDVEPQHEDEQGGASDEDVRARKLTREKNRALDLVAEREQEIDRLKAQAANQPIYQPPPQAASQDADRTDTEIYELYGSGEISETDAQRGLDRNKEKHEAELEQRIIQKVQQNQNQTKVLGSIQGAIDQYLKEIPAISDKTSDEYMDVKRKYDELISMGSPNNLITERLAIESTFGSLDRIKGTRSRNIDDYDRNHRDVSGETGGSSRPSDGPAEGSNSLKGVSREQIQFWKQNGQDPLVMVKYHTPPARRR